MAVNLATGATAYSDSDNGSGFVASYAIDNVLTTRWISANTSLPHWLAVDLGSAKKATVALIAAEVYAGNVYVKDFKMQGSNDSTNGSDGTWDDLYTGLQANNNYLQLHTWSNTTGYQWYRVYVTSTYRPNYVGFNYFQLFEDTAKPIIPFMTADNAPSPYVVSANFTPLSGYPAWEAFCPILHSKEYCLITPNGTTTGIVTVDLGKGNGQVVNGYTLATRYSSDGNARACKSWTLQGSNDNSNWTTLDTQSNVTDWTYTTVKEFAVTNSTAYRYYCLNVTANNGDTSHLTIGWLQLLGGAPAAPAASGILFATFI